MDWNKPVQEDITNTVGAVEIHKWRLIRQSKQLQTYSGIGFLSRITLRAVRLTQG